MNCCLQHYIQIDVWDHDTLNRDDFMGKIQIPVSLLSEETTACWFPLGRGSAKENIRGDIFLELTLKASQVLADIKLHTVIVSSAVKPVTSGYPQGFHL